MTNQDKRAVESMCRCGLDLEEVIASFPKLDREDIETIFNMIRNLEGSIVEVPVLKMNCS